MELEANGFCPQASRLHAGKSFPTEMSESALSVQAKTNASKSRRARILKLHQLNGGARRMERTQDGRSSTLMKTRRMLPRVSTKKVASILINHSILFQECHSIELLKLILTDGSTSEDGSRTERDNNGDSMENPS
jgi:hypothetical protein